MNSTFPGITSTITKEMNPIYHCILWSWIHRKETAALFHAAQNPMQSQQNAGFEGRKIEFQRLDNNEFKSTFFPPYNYGVNLSLRKRPQNCARN